MATSLEDIDAQIRALEDQKKALQQKARDAGLKKANDAIDELRKLGYSYRLVENSGRATGTSSGGGRRTGIRDQVLAVVKANASGIAASDVLTKLAPATEADKTSIRNALAALKRTNKVSLKDGSYFII